MTYIVKHHIFAPLPNATAAHCADQMYTCACTSTAAFCYASSHFCLHRWPHAAPVLPHCIKACHFHYYQPSVGRDSHSIFRGSAQLMSANCGCCTVRWRGACLNIELQEASEHTACSSEQTARRHDNAAPIGVSLSMVLKASRAQEGETQRGRDAGAVNAADKESQLDPCTLMLLIFLNI